MSPDAPGPRAAAAHPGRRVRVLLIDDSVVIRRMLSDSLALDPEIEVVGTAANGALGLDKIESLEPDVVVLDIEMPVLDGLGTLRELRRRNRRVPVIMFSTLTERGARATIEALANGASDYVTKPANVGSVAESREAIRTELLPRIHALGAPRTLLHRSSVSPGRAGGLNPAAPIRLAPAPAVTQQPKMLLIGSSTGGPEALGRLLPTLPAGLPVPVLIAQHMPPVFTTMLAERLNRLSALTVREASAGDVLAPGTVYLAPGDFHLEVRAESKLRLTAGLSSAPPENFCRPSVDVLFRSAVQALGGALLAVMLTGMGTDGREGSRLLVSAGGQVIAQDQATSVVWGMPGAVTNAGLASEVLPLDAISAAVVRRLGRPAGSPSRLAPDPGAVVSAL